MPHMARAVFDSSTGLTSTPAAVLATLIWSGQVNASSPFGPLMVTFWPATVAVTPAGTATGFLPIRDMIGPPTFFSFCPDQRSEHAAEHLAAHVLLAGPRIRHHALGRGQDRHAKTVGHRAQVAHRRVDSPARLGDTLDLADRRQAVRVLELDLKLRQAVLVVDARVAAD